MTVNVDFYLIAEKEPQARFSIACRLLEKAWERQNQVYIFCDTQNTAHQLDEMLWTFREDSFIPHGLINESLTPPPPIQIGIGEPPAHQREILFNLTSSIPPFYQRFSRVIELVPNDEVLREQSRENFRAYREQGCQLKTYDLGKKGE